MVSQLTQFAVNETQGLMLEEEVKQSVAQFVNSYPIQQKEVEQHLELPQTQSKDIKAHKSGGKRKCRPAKSKECSSSSLIINLSEDSASNTSSNATLVSTQTHIREHIGNRIPCTDRARDGRTAGAMVSTAGRRTFISRHYDAKMVEQLDNDQQQTCSQSEPFGQSYHGHPSNSHQPSCPAAEQEHPNSNTIQNAFSSSCNTTAKVTAAVSATKKPKQPSSSSPSATKVSAAGLVPPRACPNSAMERFRQQLPTWRLRDHILQCIDSTAVTLVTGGTGCGKTTQVPQFLLEHATEHQRSIRILCTQPRRLPAIAVAKRVALERGERLGGTVGYHIRLEPICSNETVLTYCTSGVLLRKLTADELVEEATHVILDEIHERETNTDYLLIAIRQALKRRKDLKVILMSATMGDNISKFTSYFKEAGIQRIDIPCQMFEVKQYHLADILALTGYMPQSQMFDERVMHTSASAPLFGQFVNNPWCPTPAAALFPSPDPSPVPYGTPPPPPDGNPFSVPPPSVTIPTIGRGRGGRPIGGFASRERTRPLSLDIRQRLNAVLHDRPTEFNPDYLPRLTMAWNFVPRKGLVDVYLDGGGRQWRDSVDGELVTELIRFLMDSPVEGSILVFLPGYEEISKVYDMLITMLDQHQLMHTAVVFTLHSQFSTDKQQRVFDAVEEWQRKVVLSTNIAESSITIDDVVFVIDCGKAKVKGYDHNTRVSQLTCQRIAKSNAEQRKGRAGRCQAGFCFRLYTEEEYTEMLDNQVPEMKRSAIHDVCLHAKMYAPGGGMTVQKFLKLAPDPPGDVNVQLSLNFLEQLGAIYYRPLPEQIMSPPSPPRSIVTRPHRGHRYEGLPQSQPSPNRHSQMYCAANIFGSSMEDEERLELTELGRLIASLPLEPQLARLLLFGVALRCLSPVLTLVAAMSAQDPFVLGIGDEETQRARAAKDEFAQMDYSDHLVLIRAFDTFQIAGSKQQWCREKMLSEPKMQMIQGIRRQLLQELRRLRLLPNSVFHPEDPAFNRYSWSWPMVQGCIVAGAYPNVGYVRAGAKMTRIKTVVAKHCALHPSSSLRRQTAPSERRSDLLNRCLGQRSAPMIQYLVYQEVVGSENDTQILLRTVTAVPQLPIFLFTGPIRMDPKCVAHFELVDPDGSLRARRDQWRERAMRERRKEERACEREMRRRVRAQAELHRRYTEEQQQQQMTGGQQQNANGWANTTGEDGWSWMSKEANHAGNQQSSEQLSLSSSSASYDSCVSGRFDGNRLSPSSLSSSAMSELEPELAEEMALYSRDLLRHGQISEPEELLELDQWFAFRGTFTDLQLMVKLRFRLMQYFTRQMAHPEREMTQVDKELLECLNNALTMAHRAQGFGQVDNLVPAYLRSVHRSQQQIPQTSKRRSTAAGRQQL